MAGGKGGFCGGSTPKYMKCRPSLVIVTNIRKETISE